MPHYKLIETGTYPALVINGILMHRIKNTDPKRDAQLKIKIMDIRGGRVLDTCMGLGYTAICASKNADSVVTVEKDKNVVEIAKQNPCSSKIFESDKINLIQGDVFEEVKKFSDGYFDYIIHDPPRFGIAGNLYGEEFYKNLYRILADGWKLFHYVGSPGKRYRKKEIRKGVMNRLRNAGFLVRPCEEAEGVIGRKYGKPNNQHTIWTAKLP